MRPWPLALLLVVLGIALFKPFQGVGDYMVGPGGGDLLNGGVALTLLIIAGIAAMIVRRRRKGETK